MLVSILHIGFELHKVCAGCRIRFWQLCFWRFGEAVSIVSYCAIMFGCDHSLMGFPTPLAVDE